MAAGVLLRCIAPPVGPSLVDGVTRGRWQWRPGGVSGGARRPKPAKLACNPRLSKGVEDKLGLWRSPFQISRWLMDAYPGDEEMQVSHETIYQSLLIRGIGALRKELWRCLPTLGSQGDPGVDLANCSSWSGR